MFSCAGPACTGQRAKKSQTGFFGPTPCKKIVLVVRQPGTGRLMAQTGQVVRRHHNPDLLSPGMFTTLQPDNLKLERRDILRHA